MKTRIFTLIVSLFIATMAFAYDVQIDDIYYNLDKENKTAEVTYGYGYGEYSGNITIPATILCNGETYRVTSIGSEAFYYCSSLTSITIPNSVTTIEGYAFNKSSLTSISIGSNVTSIESYAFYGCPSLSSVQWNVKKYNDFSENNTPFYYRKSGYTDSEYNLKGQITSFTFGDSVEYIPAYLCHNMSNLTSITIPNSVTSIGEAAFRNCSSLTSISFGSNVTSIGEAAFRGCSSLTSISIGSNVTSIGEAAFRGCSALTSITIPNSVTSIGGGAFSVCSSLTSITIPNSVTSIGDEAFYDCSSLTSISIPNSVTSINRQVFAFCGKLRNVEIGNSIESIDNEAFRGCSGIYSLKIGTMIPPIVSATTFTDVSRTMQIKVPCGSIAAYQSSSYWNEFTNYIESPYTLTINVNDATMGVAVITKQATCSDVTAQVQAQAKPGYKFVGWSDGFTENPHTVFVTEDMTITAEFAIDQYQVTLKSNGNGSVTGSGTYDYGTKITIEAIANKGYHFEKWSDGNTENPRTITVTEDIELSATFELNETPVENVQITSANVYSRNGILHVEGAETDYYVLDMAGRLIYSGRDTEVQLPRGVYLVTIKGEVQKIVL